MRQIAVTLRPGREDSRETVEALQNGIRGALANYVADSRLFDVPTHIVVSVETEEGQNEQSS
jgi:hypothetical protein